MNLTAMAAFSRRNFFKLAAGVLVAGAIAFMGGNAAPAYADTPTAAGTYTVTANVYVDSSDSPIGQNAYLTNPGQPPANKPVTPVSQNATLTIDDQGHKTLTVPLVNDVFGATSIPEGVTSNSAVSVTSVATQNWKVPSNFLLFVQGPDTRVSTVTFDVTGESADTFEATMSNCEEYAAFRLYAGNKSWDLHLDADLSTAVAK